MTVDTDVVPLAPHRVIGALQTVVHAALSARFFGPPKVVVATAVHFTSQLLIVLAVHEDVEDVEVGLGLVDVRFPVSVAEVVVSSSGSNSLRASSNGFKPSSNLLTVSIASFVPLTTLSFTLLVVSIMHATNEKAVLNKPSRKLRLSSV